MRDEKQPSPLSWADKWNSWGDVPEWVDIPGYEGKYRVSKYGQICGLDRPDARGHHIKGRALRPAVGSHGYPVVVLSFKVRKQFTVHEVVISSFVGPRPERMEVLHADGSRTINRLDNLRYGTRVDNLLDAVKHGTRKSQLTPDQATKILNYLGKDVKWEKYKELAKSYAVDPVTIYNLHIGRTWKYLRSMRE